MPKRTSKKESDINILASRIVEEATTESTKEVKPEKNPAAIALGRLGGKKGGPARAKALTKDMGSK